MDTKTAISTIQAMLSTINSEISGLQGQADALTTALGVLQGTLTVQLQELEDVKAQVATMMEAPVDAVSMKSAPLAG